MRFVDDLLVKDSVLLICGDKVWIGKTGQPLMVTIIENQEIANLLKFMHQFIWRQLDDKN